MADSTPAEAATAGRPVKPSEDEFNQQRETAEKEYKRVMDLYNGVKAKIELATSSNKDSPQQKHRFELISQLNDIRNKQTGFKKSRTSTFEQIKRLEEQVRSRVTEQKSAKSKVPFKSVEDLDLEVNRLDKQVSSGTMKLVDEKKALAEISSLRKLRKNFVHLDEQQKQIDDLRAKIKEMRDSLDDPEAKALSEKYDSLQAELDTIKAEQDEAFKNMKTLRDERTRLQAEQEQKFMAIKKIKDDYFTSKKAFATWERERRQKDFERRKAEREAFEKSKKMERAQKMLAEASDPAYLEEIRRANSLLHFYDPSHVPAEKSPLLADKGLAAQAQRKVDDAGIKGLKVIRKEDRDDEFMPAQRKGKKGKKFVAPAADNISTKFSCPSSVMEDCAFIGIEPPMSAADVPLVVEKVKGKLEQWRKDQPEQTGKNIEKARKEIARLEAEEAGEIGHASPPNGVNGSKHEAEETAVSETADRVEKATLQESSEVTTAA